MPDISLAVFQKRNDDRRDPLLGFKWVCLALPFGLDVTYVEEVDLGFPKIGQRQGLFGAGTFSYYPAFEEMSAFNITFYEDSKMTTSKWLDAWMRRIRNKDNGTYYLPYEYKRDMLFALMDTSGAIVAEVKMINTWPTERSSWPLAYTNNDRIRVQQNFSVDRQEIVYKK